MAQLTVSIGDCYLRKGKDGKARVVIEVTHVAGGRVYVNADGVDFQSQTWYPIHFFDDEDELGIDCRIPSVECGRRLIVQAQGWTPTD
jgi:hypothetical protein